MKKLALILVIFLFAINARATNYFMAPASGGGSDSNNGLTSGTPWLSPSHAVNCGDVISAAAGTYVAASSFTFGSFGTVTGSGHCVAWVICATFAACSVTGGAMDGPAMWLTAGSSHWGIKGFVLSNTEDDFGCIQLTGGPHDIIIVDNVFNGCHGGMANNDSNDYLAIIANAVYNAAQESSQCASGVAINVPLNFDTVTGTHIFIAQNFAWDNVNPNPCHGGTPTDGHGLILDTLSSHSYTGQIVVKNNINYWNGGAGMENFSDTTTPVYIYNNTVYGNDVDTTNVTGVCAGIYLGFPVVQTQSYNNLVVSPTNYSCGGNNVYAMVVASGDATDHVYNNWALGVGGRNTDIRSSPAFSYGPNNTLSDPVFTNPPLSMPPAPSCGGKLNVIDCMSTTIAQFVPTAVGTTGLGYQLPVTGSFYDPLFPQWLCQYSSQLSGLVTMGCLTANTAVAPGVVLLQGVTIQ